MTTKPSAVEETTYPRDFDTEAVISRTQRGSAAEEEDTSAADISLHFNFFVCVNFTSPYEPLP